MSPFSEKSFYPFCLKTFVPIHGGLLVLMVFVGRLSLKAQGWGAEGNI